MSTTTGNSAGTISRHQVGGLIRNYRRTLTHGAVHGFTIRLLGTVLAFTSQIVLARFLGAAGYGIYAYCIGWMTMATLMITLGFPPASQRYVSQYHVREEWGLLRGFRRVGLRTVVSASLVVCVVVDVLAWWMLRHRPDGELLCAIWTMSLILPVAGLLQLHEAVLRALKRIVEALGPTTLLRPALILAGLPLAFALCGFSASAVKALLINLIATVIALALSATLLRRAMPTECRRVPAVCRTQKWLVSSFALALAGTFMAVMAHLDIVMVGAVLGTTAAGKYAVISRAAALGSCFVSQSINTILAPVAADLHARRERDALQRIVTLGVRGAVLGAVCGSVFLACWGDRFLMLFGREFSGNLGVLYVLLGAQCARTCLGPVSMLLAVTGYEKACSVIAGFCALLNLALNALLIPLLGLLGAAIATGSTLVLWGLVSAVVVNRRLGISTLPFATLRPFRHVDSRRG